MELVQQLDLMLKAKELIALGARMQVLEDLTPIPREKLLKLYKEIQGKAPPRGLLPFSVEWFLEWQPSLHTALYLSRREMLLTLNPRASSKDLLAPIYKNYLHCTNSLGMEPVLSLTRAWSVERFLNAKMLKKVACTCCNCVYVGLPHENSKYFVCGLCKVPARAGLL